MVGAFLGERMAEETEGSRRPILRHRRSQFARTALRFVLSTVAVPVIWSFGSAGWSEPVSRWTVGLGLTVPVDDIFFINQYTVWLLCWWFYMQFFMFDTDIVGWNLVQKLWNWMLDSNFDWQIDEIWISPPEIFCSLRLPRCLLI